MGFYLLKDGVHKKIDTIRAKFLWQGVEEKLDIIWPNLIWCIDPKTKGV
jgi:hypothetical protein